MAITGNSKTVVEDDEPKRLSSAQHHASLTLVGVLFVSALALAVATLVGNANTPVKGLAAFLMIVMIAFFSVSHRSHSPR